MAQIKAFCIVVVLIIFSVFGIFSYVYDSLAEEKPKTVKEVQQEMSSEQQEMMKNWEEYAKPNENHKVLGAMVGEWLYTVKWWMKPGSEPEESVGKSETEWKFDGRFIEHEVIGSHMGKPFEGMGLMGYDNEKEEYNSLWIDNMGTGMMTASGQYDPETKTFSEVGTFSCPQEGVKSFRAITRIIDRNNFTYELYMNDPEGDEFRAMEIKYKRKQ